MVSIQYGGGPTLEQRQTFCNLRPGSHVPGYLGFVPQLKFHNGKTYGKETHDCSRKLPYYSGPHPQTVLQYFPEVGSGRDCSSTKLFKDEVVFRKLPIPTGDNKYIQKMMPGYSGDIPRLVNRFGGTFRAMCDEGVEEFITDYERNSAKQADTIKMASLFPRLRAICGDPRVKDHMNLWSDALLKRSTLVSDRKPLTEPPMPGYTGYIPRIYNTELGLGARYNQATMRGLEVFRDEGKIHFSRLTKPMTVTDNVYTVANQLSLSLSAPSEPKFSRRIFNKDGLIPEYTGHVHKAREEVGYTIGDTTRSLEVCKHDFSCFGDYMKNMDLVVE